MPTWVRKDENGRIVEKTTVDPTGRFHPSVVWYKFTDTTSPAAIDIQKQSMVIITDNVEEESEESDDDSTANTSSTSTEGGE
jgi:hypothetical protein